MLKGTHSQFMLNYKKRYSNGEKLLIDFQNFKVRSNIKLGHLLNNFQTLNE